MRKLRNHDFVLSAREQEDGYILACSNTAISDLVIEAREADAEEALPHQKIRATVRKIEPIGDDLALLHVQTPRTQSLRFKAGQKRIAHHREMAAAPSSASPVAPATDAIFSFWWRDRRETVSATPSSPTP